ncbi:MAG: CDP-glycerol glycerophosphotransferase family protein [Verrucomicrobia bacterium]|nr:CDP-glycerol glycerophosphotransferase family protein [Verrucomicrobiota bacterium]
MTSERWIAIHTGLPHYLDHLGILCIELGLTLLVTEEATYEAARKFYPQLQCRLTTLKDLSLEYLATHFDVIFESGHLWALELQPLFELLFNKKMRIVYCPHGNSDKGHSQKKGIPKDISLVYGSHMMDHLKKTESILAHTILTGNYRYTYYRKHQEFYDTELQHAFKGKLTSSKKTIFFAPSWPDGENRSSFAECSRVLEEVGEFYNVIVRWHPFLEELFPAEIEKLLGQYEKREDIVFLSGFPCIYPILNAAHGYLGDFSSVGYDFLAFNKPLFFLDSHFGALYKCGLQLDLNQHLGQSILRYEDSFHQLRQETYRYVFGEEREGRNILKDLTSYLGSTAG